MGVRGVTRVVLFLVTLAAQLFTRAAVLFDSHTNQLAPQDFRHGI